jgi:hypothetical protein
MIAFGDRLAAVRPIGRSQNARSCERAMGRVIDGRSGLGFSLSESSTARSAPRTAAANARSRRRP